MSFTQFRNKIEEKFNLMAEGAKRLFVVNADPDELWNVYLDSFPAGKNEIFKERRSHDCSCCRHFIKNVGNVVSIKDGVVTSIWDVDIDDDTYKPVAEALSTFVKSKPVIGVYLSSERLVGTPSNYEYDENGTSRKWTHFYVNIPDICFHRSRDIGAAFGSLRDTRNVFKRSLDEITMDSIDTVLELIMSNTLYRGEEWKASLTDLKKHKAEYDALSEEQKELYTWEQSTNVGASLGRIRNHSIGVLLTDISEGMDLNAAVQRYEKIVAPANYKRPKAIYTKKMLEEAQHTVEELGYADSLGRRHATLDDINVGNILFSNKDAQKRVKGATSVFDDMAADVRRTPKRFDRVEEVPVEKFISDILPGATSVEAYVENRHAPNFVSLIAPRIPDSKSMFKWDNGFSWAYKGNLTDSDVKENVKNAGGRVDGVLRFSIQWNEDGHDNCDLDAHCVEPSKFELYYGQGKRPQYSPTHGQLDVDIVMPSGRVAVENIVWDSKKTMSPGDYRFFVHQFSGSAKNGFRAEIEFDGRIYSFDYARPMHTGQDVQVATVTLHKDGTFTIKEDLNSEVSSKEIWGVKTNDFVPVSVIMYSPNYWNGEHGVGNRHYMFMLKDCVNDEQPNGFYNEFLKSELDKHKRVFEALGGRMAVEPAEDQLSGVGFSATKRNELVVKVAGSTERVLKIKF